MSPSANDDNYHNAVSENQPKLRGNLFTEHHSPSMGACSKASRLQDTREKVTLCLLSIEIISIFINC